MADPMERTYYIRRNLTLYDCSNFHQNSMKKGLSCTYKENENLSKTAKADLLVTIRPLLMVSPFACSKSIWHCRFMTAPCSYISCHMKNKELLLAESKPWLYVRSEVQVNNYEIVVNLFHISHNLTWYSAIVHKFTRIYPVCSTYELTKQFM